MIFQVQGARIKAPPAADFEGKELADAPVRKSVPQKVDEVVLDPKSAQGQKVLADIIKTVDLFNLAYANHVHSKDLRPIDIPLPDTRA